MSRSVYSQILQLKQSVTFDLGNRLMFFMVTERIGGNTDHFHCPNLPWDAEHLKKDVIVANDGLIYV